MRAGEDFQKQSDEITYLSNTGVTGSFGLIIVRILFIAQMVPGTDCIVCKLECGFHC